MWRTSARPTDGGMPSTCAMIALLCLLCTQVTGAEANNVTVGGSCATSSDCYDNRACIKGTCCAFQTRTASYPWYSNYYDTSAIGNCTDCSYNSTRYSNSPQYSCNACAAGSELYVDWSPGSSGYRCRKSCDPATEYRRYSSDSYCTKKGSAGAPCTTVYGQLSASATCLSGHCGGSYCCAHASGANSSSCPVCDVGTGACSNTSQIGGSCATSSDCYDNRACIKGTCCAFQTRTASYPWYSNYYDTSAIGNCTDCSYNSTRYSNSPQYSCNACAAGSELYVDWSPGSSGYRCRKSCDPATEYRRYSSDSYCTKKVSAGAPCTTVYGQWSASATCLSGHCGGSYCCDQAAAVLANCTLCASISGRCLAQTSIRPPPPSPPPPPPSPPATSAVAGGGCPLLSYQKSSHASLNSSVSCASQH